MLTFYFRHHDQALAWDWSADCSACCSYGARKQIISLNFPRRARWLCAVHCHPLEPPGFFYPFVLKNPWTTSETQQGWRPPCLLLFLTISVISARPLAWPLWKSLVSVALLLANAACREEKPPVSQHLVTLAWMIYMQFLLWCPLFSPYFSLCLSPLLRWLLPACALSSDGWRLCSHACYWPELQGSGVKLCLLEEPALIPW